MGAIKPKELKGDWKANTGRKLVKKGHMRPHKKASNWVFQLLTSLLRIFSFLRCCFSSTSLDAAVSASSSLLPSLLSNSSQQSLIDKDLKVRIDVDPRANSHSHFAPLNSSLASHINNYVAPLGFSLENSPFKRLSVELCLHILRLLDPLTSAHLAQTCRHWYSITTDELLYLAYSRRFFNFKRLHSPSLTNPSVTLPSESWKTVFQRLDDGRTTWIGFALDPATNNFRPYPLELHVNSTFKTVLIHESETTSTIHFDACCRWASLRDSLTRAAGTMTYISPQRWGQANGFLNKRVMEFQEIELLRGDNIAIPNTYKAVILGPVIIGMYDPGHPAFRGVFVAVMQESFSKHLKVSNRIYKARDHFTGQFTKVSDQFSTNNCSLSLSSPTTGIFVVEFFDESSKDSKIIIPITMDPNGKQMKFSSPSGLLQKQTNEAILWAESNLPIGGNAISLIRLGDFLVGFISDPVITVFFLEM
ncbi:hypothetical protein HK096_004777 [Nowakowskiella sp. JEL0078]|nr:hypothetical protein HK096_004777 [Nowakowskiella sp. JEL0078]